MKATLIRPETTKMAHNSSCIFIGKTDLNRSQIRATQIAYQKNAATYALSYERTPQMAKIFSLYLDPFLRFYKKLPFPHQPILFAGCGSCRDLQYCENKGYPVIGIDTSRQLLDIAKAQGVKSPLVTIDILKYKFRKNEFGGIYCDTALTHASREMLCTSLAAFHHTLVKNGVLFMEFRKGSGQTYKTIDQFGTRYYLTHSLPQVTCLLEEAGFKIRRVNVDSHSIAGRPDFIAIIATKI